MNIGITGYGTMGKYIRDKACEKGYTVSCIIDPSSTEEEVTHTSAAELSDDVELDVIIEFSAPDAVIPNLKEYAERGLSVVIGTSGWYENMDEASRIVQKSGIGCIWSGNFSLGVNLFFRIIQQAGSIMNLFPQYDCMVHEYFHKNKADSPSGTAEMIGKMLIDRLDRKTSLVSESLKRKIHEDEIHVSSTRGGTIPGIHRVMFDSNEDTILLEHTAKNRAGFVEGALAAAQWLAGRKGFFSIEEMMDSILYEHLHT